MDYITLVHNACPIANYEEMLSDLFDEPFRLSCFDLALPLILPLHPAVDHVALLIPPLPSSALGTSPTSRALCFCVSPAYDSSPGPVCEYE